MGSALAGLDENDQEMLLKLLATVKENLRQVIGEFEQESVRRTTQFVIGVAAHLVGEFHQLAVDAVADEMIDEAGRPGG